MRFIFTLIVCFAVAISNDHVLAEEILPVLAGTTISDCHLTDIEKVSDSYRITCINLSNRSIQIVDLDHRSNVVSKSFMNAPKGLVALNASYFLDRANEKLINVSNGHEIDISEFNLNCSNATQESTYCGELLKENFGITGFLINSIKPNDRFALILFKRSIDFSDEENKFAVIGTLDLQNQSFEVMDAFNPFEKEPRSVSISHDNMIRSITYSQNKGALNDDKSIYFYDELGTRLKIHSLGLYEDYTFFPNLNGGKVSTHWALTNSVTGASALYKVYQEGDLIDVVAARPNVDIANVELYPGSDWIDFIEFSSNHQPMLIYNEDLRSIFEALSQDKTSVLRRLAISRDNEYSLYRIIRSDLSEDWFIIEQSTGDRILNFDPKSVFQFPHKLSQITPTEVVEIPLAHEKGAYIEALYSSADLNNKTGRKDRPLLVLLHGGPYARHSIFADDDVKHLVSWGYDVLRVNYRGSSGRGISGAWSHLYGGPDSYSADIIQAIETTVETFDLEPSQVGLLGYSYGGLLALDAVAHYPNMFASVSAIAPPAHILGRQQNFGHLAHLDDLLDSPEQFTAPDFGEVFGKPSASLFVVGGTLDPVAPTDPLKSLFDAYGNENKCGVIVENGRHFAWSETTNKAVTKALRAFLQNNSNNQQHHCANLVTINDSTE